MNRTHDPSARLDYEWNWSSWLHVGETIDTYDVSVTPADVMVAEDITATDDAVVAWVRGGVRGRTYQVSCHILTTEAREDDRSFTLAVQNR